MTRALAVILLAATASADVRLAGLFGDGMVLQRDRKIAIWGWAASGERVKVSFAGKSAKATTDTRGRWRVEMGPFAASAGRKLEVSGKNRIVLQDVCVGEVWLCSGQSNMAWPVKAALRAKEEIAAADDARLRLYTIPHRATPEAAEDVEGSWVACAPATVQDFSAVAYYFGRELRRKLGLPVGLIHASWGGTPAEAWTRRKFLTSESALQPIVERWDQELARFPEANKLYLRELDEWKQKVKLARETGLLPPRRPQAPRGNNHPHCPAALFNGMIHPLRAYGVAGVIWYQGESNAKRAEQYRTLFPTLIQDWRKALDRPKLPFLFVQLANYMAVQDRPGGSAWAELREAQAMTLRLPHTAMAVTIDIGDARDIHPKNKQEVGRRLALAARATVYGESDLVFRGPVYAGHRIVGDRVEIRFESADGLRARGDDPPTGFAIAGKDQVFRWAHARIEGDTVVARHPRVAQPVAVRYGWADNPRCNLENGAGLPAAPFRTDDWRGLTTGAR